MDEDSHVDQNTPGENEDQISDQPAETAAEENSEAGVFMLESENSDEEIPEDK